MKYEVNHAIHAGKIQVHPLSVAQCAAALDVLLQAYKSNGRMDYRLQPHHRFEVNEQSDGSLRIHNPMRASSSQGGDYCFFMGMLAGALPGRRTINTFTVPELMRAITAFAGRYQDVNEVRNQLETAIKSAAGPTPS